MERQDKRAEEMAEEEEVGEEQVDKTRDKKWKMNGEQLRTTE